MNILVIPDIHGRKFWKQPVKDISKYDKVVFLGDYLDPYPFENISEEQAISNFKEIIEFKLENLDKIILLLGNHDLPYYFKIEGVSRWSNRYHKDIEKIFLQNKKLFKLAYETDLTLFTHAGYLNSWSQFCLENFDYIINPTAESINNILFLPSKKFNKNISDIILYDIVPRTRGGYYNTASCVWGDLRDTYYELEEGENNLKYQVFGHTLQLNTNKYYQTFKDDDIEDGTPKIFTKFAMLDCRHAFEYNEEKREFIQL